MTDFTDLELTEDIPDMEEDEAKETLSEFMEAHKQNRTAYDELAGELDEVETEYQDKLEQREDLIAEFKQERAEKAAEYTNVPADIMVERFELEELDQIIEEGDEEFSDPDENEDEEDEPSLLNFSEQEEKGVTDTESPYRDRARKALGRQGFPVEE